MANATATPVVNSFPDGIDNTQRNVKVTGTLTVSASPATYPTGGLALSWAGLRDNAGNPIQAIGANANPYMVWIDSVGGGLFDYGWNKATGNFQIFAASAGVAGSAPFEELPNATAIPAGVSGDVIQFEAWFAKNLG